MLKLLLSHWQAHREPLPFVLTDDPLYCSHLTKSPFPEVYSVNRVNPIFEDDEAKTTGSSLHLKRSLSEERRENETRASDDTGYSSSGQFKSATTAGSLTDDVGSLDARRMSSDSDESSSQPGAVVVSADVHRVSYPEDVIVLSSSSSNSSHTFSANSYYSDSSQEPFDSLTMSSATDEAKRPNLAVRDKLQKLLERGNEAFLDSLDPKPAPERDMAKTRNDLIQSLNRALNSKVPKKESDSDQQAVTRTESTNEVLSDRRSNSSSTSPKMVADFQKGVTRQDESSASSSLGSSSKQQRKHPHRSKNHTEKESKTNDSSDSQKTRNSHKCKLCENVHRPLAFHQLLPGHWSYDNVYLPQIPGMCCPCYHHNPSYQPSSDDDVFYPLYYHHDIGRARHSWAPYTNNPNIFENHPKLKKNTNSEEKTSSKENTSGHRYSPDGTSRETDSSHADTNNLKKSISERRSLREPKKCKCDHCLSSVLDKDCVQHFHPEHACTCYCLSHRRVKFASDTDVSQHRHLQAGPFRLVKEGANGDTINAAVVMNLPHLNGHVMSKAQAAKDNVFKSKIVPPLIPRGLKEPVKMDELYRSYPINFRDWEAHYRRTFLQKRKKESTEHGWNGHWYHICGWNSNSSDICISQNKKACMMKIQCRIFLKKRTTLNSEK